MGLSNARKIVQMHGGEISAQPNGAGTSVMFTLPHSVS